MNNNQFNKSMQTIKNYVDENIPTKTSQLTNDSGFITEVPSEYITETELNNKGFATETYVQNKIAEAQLGGSGSGIKWLDVEEGEIFQTLISCMGITLSSSNLSFTENTTQTLTVNVRPSDTSDEVVWSVNPTGIVSVNNGIVTPLINGDCIITATCGNYSATCNVNVSLPVVIECTGITLSSNALSFSTSDTQTLTATIQPSDCTQTPIWSVKPAGVVSIENNVVTPLVNGDCTISVTCGSQVASCTVNVSCFITTYTITNKLTNVISDNSATSIAEGVSYNATLTAKNNYEISSVLVTMGGVDITSTAYSDGTISISNVTGNIEIIASAISTVQPTFAQPLTFVKNGDGTMYYEWDRLKMIEYGKRTNNFCLLITNKANSYNNDTYAMYNIQANNYINAGVIINRNIFKYIAQAKVIDISQSGALTDTTTILSDNEFYVSASSSSSAVSVRIPKALGVDGKANDWLLNFINTDTIKLPVTTEPKTFEINPDNITNMTIEINDDTCQYARFNMSSYPASNIYKGFNTLFGITGTSANLSEATVGIAACATTVMSIKFYPGTFTEFTLDNVKQYLTEHPLIFYYEQNN